MDGDRLAERYMQKARIESENARLDIANTEGILSGGGMIVAEDPTLHQEAYFGHHHALKLRRERLEIMRNGNPELPKIQPIRPGDVVASGWCRLGATTPRPCTSWPARGNRHGARAGPPPPAPLPRRLARTSRAMTIGEAIDESNSTLIGINRTKTAAPEGSGRPISKVPKRRISAC
jgi:hypothetical protein